MLVDFRRHPWLHIVSVSTVAIALLIVGFFLLCYRNFERIAESTNPNTTGTLYLREGLSEIQIYTVRDRILALEHVHKAVYKTKDTVMRELSAFLGTDDPERIPTGELFPDVIELELSRDAPSGTVGILKATLAQFSEIAEADFSEDWLVHYKKIRGFLKAFSVLFIIGMVLGCSFLIANFMGMRYQQRKNEIDIVRLIGASHKFVLSPFLWEGLLEGILGTTCALLLLYGIKSAMNAWLSSQWASLLGITEWLYLSTGQWILMGTVGALMAFLGGIGVFLRFREGPA
jgi:cell division transport system permease protein